MLGYILEYWVEFLFGFSLSVLTASMTWILKRVKRRNEEQDAIKEGVLAILHDRLIQAGRLHIKTGVITLDELQNMEILYCSYHNLGGNGTGTEVFERIRNLPIED